jgi:hypothetical protein
MFGYYTMKATSGIKNNNNNNRVHSVAFENSPENYSDLDVAKRAWNYQVVVAFFL